ncbi:hypothetical protein Strain138_000407 [Pseudogemmatithrix spongiicola]|uniref:Uncharacterized protein n=1 Tax=Pseudogemmatithrix spongiicola TaxID=3062599 RepID=A0AA49Q6J1_9BACT|nr:hypothetical protein Strain138_000407 [Gemmatimonadaceae bacterium 'strain 138']WKW14082.1 hypothetical protein Strain318_000407 [Gemmatimonadaceae bacterium 'strain 318']
MSERDAMICRACGKQERASEGYPCESCGTFICQICVLKGVTLCASCQAAEDAKDADEDA